MEEELTAGLDTNRKFIFRNHIYLGDHLEELSVDIDQRRPPHQEHKQSPYYEWRPETYEK